MWLTDLENELTIATGENIQIKQSSTEQTMFHKVKMCENFAGFGGITYDMAVLRASSQSDTSFLLSE